MNTNILYQAVQTIIMLKIIKYKINYIIKSWSTKQAVEHLTDKFTGILHR